MTDSDPPASSARVASLPTVLSAAVAQASLIAALMFYLGAVYLANYYSYFHLDVFSLGIGYAELAIQSLHVLNRPLVIGLAVTLLVLRNPTDYAITRRIPKADQLAAAWARLAALLVQGHLVVVALGVLLFAYMSRLVPYGWLALVLLAGGIHLARLDARRTGFAGIGPRRANARTLAVAVLLLWAGTLAAAQMGADDAKDVGHHVVRLTGVTVFTTERYSIAGPGVAVQDLGPTVHFRYRYTGLRRLIDRSGRYYLIPVGWTRETAATYILQDSDSLRVELTLGARPQG
ncbi:hypothetical protein ACWC2T_26710 [Streptomyces sp. NPDC001393]